MRSEEEIKGRLDAYGGKGSLPPKKDIGPYTLVGPMTGETNLEDPLGVRREILLEIGLAPEGDIKSKLWHVLEYGFNKALNHRGISASVVNEQIAEIMWLLGDDEMLQFAEDDGNYPNYGVPILKAVAKKYGHPVPPEIAEWKDGEPCCPGCTNGCGK
jgi:hypothetical protein